MSEPFFEAVDDLLISAITLRILYGSVIGGAVTPKVRALDRVIGNSLAFQMFLNCRASSGALGERIGRLVAACGAVSSGIS